MSFCFNILISAFESQNAPFTIKDHIVKITLCFLYTKLTINKAAYIASKNVQWIKTLKYLEKSAQLNYKITCI